eukprot:CAMPEP_0176387970 /NCGR_PEP_ID=MMETSP0126-20121128/37189_1 /TAXON_ID=141414 ORGANISM="Strombidinopsis acuminatum, Strain SPMC142" /NCGR_SAMPLE_ID=MMETSP0126 /ASSEMBLY_ACC=CAM_ASM_000229 /LENGTH=60 /DNA_ID=CAMNT_0017755877 /DNA_START=336 /DNA_END=518 /DNA_ORIENTATION=+
MTSAGESIDRGLMLTATAGTMTELIMTPTSKIVGESTSLEVRWRAEHALPMGGFIFVNFP